MNPDRKITICQLHTGEFAAVAPYFCFVADTEEEVLELVDKAAKFYENAHPRKQPPAPLQDIRDLSPVEQARMRGLMALTRMDCSRRLI